MITNREKHEFNAKSFIDGVINNNKYRKSYRNLMVDLKDQNEKWKTEYRNLSYINIFDLTNKQYERKNYLNALIDYSELLLSKQSKTFIDNVIINNKFKKSYIELMFDLKDQNEKWKNEYIILSCINIFYLTNKQYERKKYLEGLISYSKLILSK